MNVTHHLDPATVVAAASGTLRRPYALLVEAHAAMCPLCRRELRAAEAVGGALLERIEPQPVSAAARDAVMARLGSAAAAPQAAERFDPALPAPLARLLPGGLDAVKWKRIGYGAWRHHIGEADDAGARLVMLRIAPGLTMPEHSHGGQELTLVLSGSYSDRFGRFAAGDVADHDPEVEHQPRVDSETDCICIVALEAPTRFKGLARLLQPLIGI